MGPVYAGFVACHARLVAAKSPLSGNVKATSERFLLPGNAAGPAAH
jgi:hypothetical protein